MERSITQTKKVAITFQDYLLNRFYFNIAFKALIFIIICSNYVFAKNPSVQGGPSELSVCPVCKFNSIIGAVKTIVSGGTIYVQKGIYKEGETIVIDKPLTLKGEKDSIIDGEKKFQVVTIFKTQDVTIEGLQIQNSGASFIEDLAGVKVIESRNCKILNNYFFDNTYATYIEKSDECLIKNNIIEGKAVEEVSGGNGVHVWSGTGNIIEGNTISGHRDGIYLEFAKSGVIKNNGISKNIRYGLHFMQSNETLYQKNIFADNGAGVAVMYSTKIKMVENQFTKNSGPSSYGLLLKDISDSLILRNEFTDNTIGIYMEGSNRSLFKQNQIRDNGWGLKIMGNCEGDEFKFNNFIGNTFEVVTNANHSWNTFKNNYWSQYDGFDFNGDGIGDKPHRPISLSSIILEKVESAYILLNSFFFRLIDEVERALPEMITDELMDEAPLMKEVEIKNKYD